MKKLLTLFLTLALSARAADLLMGWTASPTVDQTLAYNFYMATGGGAFSLYRTTTNTTLTVTNLTPGVYRFYVTATNMWGESIPSNTVQTPPGRPGAVTLIIQ